MAIEEFPKFDEGETDEEDDGGLHVGDEEDTWV